MGDPKQPPLSLIDLVSEKHQVLRKKLHDLNGTSVNQTEAHVLSVLNRHGGQSISELSRFLNISRQGAHKCVQGLLSGELVEVAPSDGNLRDKPVVLTDKGRACCESLEETKLRLERRIAERIGGEQVDRLKKVLAEEWF